MELDVKELEKSVKEVQKNLEKAGEVIYKAAKDEVINIVFDLLGEGMRRAPIDQGTLRGSGIAKLNDEQVAHTEQTGTGANIVKDFTSGKISLQQMVDELMGEVAFNTPYATKQHEELEYEHPKGGEAKHLEKHLKETSESYTKGLAEAIETALDNEGVNL